MSNTVMRLKKEYIEQILASPELQGKVAGACGKSVITIYRWCRENAQQLTMLSVLNAIRDYLEIDKRVSLVEEVEEETVKA